MYADERNELGEVRHSIRNRATGLYAGSNAWHEQDSDEVLRFETEAKAWAWVRTWNTRSWKRLELVSW